MSTREPTVLLIDDHPDEVSALKVELEEYLRVSVRHPGDVSLKDVKRASLILIDHQLGSWRTRDQLTEIGLQPKTGLALASVLRGHVVLDDSRGAVAFGLLSGRLRDLAGGLPQDNREHTIARCNNLEWVFAKQRSDREPGLRSQIVSLALAVRRLPDKWARDDQETMLKAIRTLLGLRKTDDWYERAWQDMEKCRPPFHELATATHGLAFLRWLLQRILPYPCFLMSTPYLAARLYVTPASLERSLATDKNLVARLKPVRYVGVLSEFVGARWWRSGVESLVWKATRRRPFDPGALKKAVLKMSPTLEWVEIRDPVVCVDEHFVATEDLVDAREALELQPDDWPSYADHAWVRIEDAREDSLLGALVVTRDRERFSLASDEEPS